ncbi:MAG: hypothetical protein AAGJ85_09005 [Pseudomonadota bacterium]
MSPFEYFDLDESTASQKDLKRAYAVRLKATRPEGDPAGFIKLRQMYDHATLLINARSNRDRLSEEFTKRGIKDARELGASDAAQTASSYAIIEPDVTPDAKDFEPVFNPTHAAFDAIEQIKTLTTRPKDADQWEQWLTIIESDDMMHIDVRPIFIDEFVEWLCTETGFYKPKDPLEDPYKAKRPLFPAYMTPDLITDMFRYFDLLELVLFNRDTQSRLHWLSVVYMRSQLRRKKRPKQFKDRYDDRFGRSMQQLREIHIREMATEELHTPILWIVGLILFFSVVVASAISII